MAYTNFQNCTKQQYETILYSGGSKNKLRIWFNGVELVDADYYCEKVTRTARILPNDGSKRFSLNNFVSTEIKIIFHDIDTSIIQDKVTISIETVVGSNSLGDIYESVPIGIFNIQDNPVTDKDKVTITLRDNACLFDFNYSAKDIIDANGGSATKMQILQDICTKANVTCDVISFNGMNDLVGIYDNTVTARIYVSELAEQSGMTPIINRNGHLAFLDYSNLTTWRIPLSIVEKYEIGEPYTIERVVYEDAIRKYETSNDDTLSTLYIDASNHYISTQDQIDYIYNLLNGFTIDSLTTGKILGNPAIDGYDIIEIYDDYNVNEPVIAKTLANHTLTYNGRFIAQYTTKIGKEERKENVTINTPLADKKNISTEIDNVNGLVRMWGDVIDNQNNAIHNAELQLDGFGLRLDKATTYINPETGEIEKVKVKNYSLDEDGFLINNPDTGYKNLSNENGNYFFDNDVIKAQFTRDNVIVKDIVLYGTYYYGVDKDLDVSNFTKDDAMFVAEKYKNENNEVGFGHFYNGG